MERAGRTCSVPGCRQIIYGYGLTDEQAANDLDDATADHMRDEHNAEES